MKGRAISTFLQATMRTWLCPLAWQMPSLSLRTCPRTGTCLDYIQIFFPFWDRACPSCAGGSSPVYQINASSIRIVMMNDYYVDNSEEDCFWTGVSYSEEETIVSDQRPENVVQKITISQIFSILGYAGHFPISLFYSAFWFVVCFFFLFVFVIGFLFVHSFLFAAFFDLLGVFCMYFHIFTCFSFRAPKLLTFEDVFRIFMVPIWISYM